MENNPGQNQVPSFQAEEMKEPLFNNFLQRGREGKSDWWRYLLGLIIVIVFYVIGQIPLTIYGVAKAKANGHSIGEIMQNQQKVIDPNWIGAPKEMVFALEMLMFVFAMTGLWIVVRFLHQKKFISIITSVQKIRWKRFAISAFVWMLICFASQFISLMMYPENYKFVFNAGPFLITLLIGLIFLPVQTWWEEFFMRGYLFQWIGMRTKKAIWPILITGTAFGLMHLANPEVKAYGVASMLPAYLLPGIFLGIMAALDEGLESAMGMHFANNLFGTIGVTSSASAIQANTIWAANEMKPSADNLSLLIGFLILLAILYKTNKWDIQKLYR